MLISHVTIDYCVVRKKRMAVRVCLHIAESNDDKSGLPAYT